MENEEKKGLHKVTVRIFPIALGGVAGFFFMLLGNYMGNFRILVSFGELLLAVTAFLLLTFIFDRIKTASLTWAEKDKEKALKKKPSKKKKLVKAASDSALDLDGEPDKKDKKKLKGAGFFAKLSGKSKSKPEIAEIAENEPDKPGEPQIQPEEIIPDTPPQPEDGLIEIKKETVSADPQAGEKHRKAKAHIYLSIFYVILLAAGVYWCVTRVMPLISSMLTGTFPDYTTVSYSIVNALLLIVFSCIAGIYLKIRGDEGKRHGDKTSRGLLTLLLYSSLLYAAGIAANSILGLKVLVTLPWLYCAVLAYIVILLVINMFVQLLKHDLLGTFDYAFGIAAFFDTDEDGADILNSGEVREKFSLKSLWTIRYTVSILPGLLLLLGLVTFLSTTVYVVQPHQQALLCRFGNVSANPVVNQGIHFKLPWPIDAVHVYDVERINSLQIGYAAANTNDFIWGVAHDGGENLMLLGNGNDVVAVNMKINYKINDLLTYYKNYSKPEDILSAAAYESIMDRTIHTTLDGFLSIDRGSLSASLAEELSEFCKTQNLGITVTQVIIQSIHPPITVAPVYQKVVTASVDKNTVVTNANAGAQSQIIMAEKQSQEDIAAAIAEQYNRVSVARDEMAIYYAAMQAYDVNPECFELTKYIEAYEKVINGRKVYVFSPGTEQNIAKFIIGKSANILQNTLVAQQTASTEAEPPPAP